MLLQDLINLTVAERIEQLEKLAGEELKTFATEVSNKEGALPILGVIVRNANTPEALIKRTLKSSLIKLGVDLTPTVVEQEKAASQPSDREPADWNKIKLFKEVAPVQPTEVEKQEFLTKFYREAAVDLDITNPLNGLEKVQGQVRDICEKMTEYGFSNFNALAPKFAEREFNIQGQQNRATVFSNAKQIKILMESILYVVENASEDNRRSLANTHRDRQFACGEGTLDNLMEIYGEMSLNKQGIAAYIVQQKKQFIREVLLPLYRNNYFAQFAMPFREGMERHDIPSLTNAVAEEFGLLVVKDKYTKDASAVAQFVSDEVNTAFAKPEAKDAFIQGVGNLLASSLENSVDEGSSDLNSQVQQFLTNLGFIPRYNYNHLVCTEDALLRDSKSIFFAMLDVFFDENRVIDDTNALIYGKCLDILGAVNSRFEQKITKEVIGELSGYTDNAWIQCVLSFGLKFDKDEFGEENPFCLLHSNGYLLDGDNLMDYYIKHNAEIRRVNPIVYFIENFPAEEFAKLNVTTTQLTDALFSINKYTKPDAAAKLVRAGADVNALSVTGRSPVRIAELRKLPAIAQVLRDNGGERIDIRCIIVKKITDLTSPDVTKEDAETLLAEIVAIIEKYPFIAREVIDVDGNTVMHFAVMKKSKVIVGELLKTQASVESLNMLNNDGEHPLSIAVKSDSQDIVTLLLQTEFGKKIIVQFLVDILSFENAESSKWLETVLKTEEGKIQLNNLRLSRDRRTALHYLCENGDLAKIKVIMAIAEGRALAVVRDVHGKMPLHLAARAGHVETMQFLLQDAIAAATLTLTNNYGLTILHKVHDDCAEILLSRPEVRRLLRSTTDEHGTTPMHMATSTFVKLALQYPEGKAAAVIADKEGRTPLYWNIGLADIPSIEEYCKVFPEILKASFSEKDRGGKTAWGRLAELNNIERIAKLHAFIRDKHPSLFGDFFQYSFLTCVIRAGNVDLLKNMLASDEAKGRLGIGDVVLAVQLGNVEIVKEVLKSFDFNYLNAYARNDIEREFLILNHAKNNFFKFNIEILKAILAIPKVLDSIYGKALSSYCYYIDFEALDVVLGYKQGQEALLDSRFQNTQLQINSQTLLHVVLRFISQKPENQAKKECLNVIIKALKRCADKDKVAALLRVQDSQGKTVLDLADEETRERLEACEYILLKKVPALPTGVPSASTSSTAVASTSLQSNMPAETSAAEVVIEEEVMLVKKRRSDRSTNPANKKRDTTSKDLNKRKR
jgi:ankyrin repeat protein